MFCVCRHAMVSTENSICYFCHTTYINVQRGLYSWFICTVDYLILYASFVCKPDNQSQIYLPPTKEEVCTFARICLSVSKITQKCVPGFGWNVACRQMLFLMNWFTFEPDPDYSLDAGTGLLSPLSYKCWYAEFYFGKSDVYVLVAVSRRGFKMVLRPTAAATRDFYSLSQWAVETPLSKLHVLHWVPF